MARCIGKNLQYSQEFITIRFGKNSAMTHTNKRKVILHGHMFKNAGTSVDKLLLDNFGKAFVDHRDDVKMQHGRQSYLMDLLQKNKKIRALSSHHLPLPLEPVPDIDLLFIIMLRHPIVRVGSVYRFEKIQKRDTPGAIAAKKYNFQDYIRWRLDVRPVVISNYFVQYCTSTLKANTSLQDRYHSALNFTTHTAFTGIVEHFDSSMVFIKDKIETSGGKFMIKSVRENITDTRKEPLERKLSKLQTKLGDALYDELVSVNAYDIALYNSLVERYSFTPNEL